MAKEVQEEVQRWTVKRRAALVLSILKAKTSVVEAARKHGLTVAEVEDWKERFMLAAENALRARHPSYGAGLPGQTYARTADEKDGLRGNVCSHRPYPVHLTASSKNQTESLSRNLFSFCFSASSFYTLSAS